MSQVHGKNVKVLFNGLDLSGSFNQFDRANSVDSVDVATFGDGDHEYLAGLLSGTFAWNFIYNNASPNVDADIVEDDITNQTPRAVMLIPNGVNGGTNGRAVTCADKCTLTSYNIGSSISDAVKGSGGFQTQQGLRGAILLHALTAETTSPGTGYTAQKNIGVKTVTSSSAANPSVIVTSAPHGWASGDAVTIEGHTGATPALNDSTFTITVIDATSFSLDGQAVTVGGTGGTATRVSSRGAKFYLQWTGVQGTTPSVTIDVKDSFDGTTWATLDSFAAITGADPAGTAILDISGIVREFVRLEWTITGSATPGATFAVACARNN